MCLRALFESVLNPENPRRPKCSKSPSFFSQRVWRRVESRSVKLYPVFSLTDCPSTFPYCCPQVSLHTCPRALFRELRHVFPGVDLEACLAVPTSQKADMDLVAMGDTVETEKDRLLNSVREPNRLAGE